MHALSAAPRRRTRSRLRTNVTQADRKDTLLLPCATTALSLIVVWSLIRATPRGQP